MTHITATLYGVVEEKAGLFKDVDRIRSARFSNWRSDVESWKMDFAKGLLSLHRFRDGDVVKITIETLKRNES